MTKICSKCDIEKELLEYRKNLSFCKKCEKLYSVAYGSIYLKTLNGKFNGMLHHAKESAKKRFEIGRIDAGEFDITNKNLHELWEKQCGLCYYSHLPMKYDKKVWMVSLERLDNSIGYIKDNIVLCCAEFNGRVHWSKIKIDELLKILNNPIRDNIINFDLIKKSQKKHEFINKIIINNIEYYDCNYCNELKLRDDFNKSINNGCKKCIREYKIKYLSSPRGCMIQLLSSAKSSTKRRNKTNNDKRVNDFDISFDYLVEVFNNQKGLCKVSGIPMTFGNCEVVNWKISLERINPLLGYIKGNICFICCEWNTSDQSIMYKEKQEGSSSWSPEKFKIFIDNVRNQI